MTSSEEEGAGRPTWAANSGWSGAGNPAGQTPEPGGKRYRRSEDLDKESPPVEIPESSKDSSDGADEASTLPTEELITQREPANPSLETEGEEERLSDEQIWRKTLLQAGTERLQELTDRLLSLGGEIQGDRAYVTRIAPGVMAHVTVSVKLRKG